MTAYTCDAEPEELDLLLCLRELAANSRPVAAGLPQGLVTGGSALPGYRLVTSWTEMFRAWQKREPELSDLIALRALTSDLSARRMRFHDGSGADPLSEALVEINLLSKDQDGLDPLGVEVWLSGYTDLLLEQP